MKFVERVEGIGNTVTESIFGFISEMRGVMLEKKHPPMLVDNIVFQALFRTLAIHMTRMIECAHEKDIPKEKMGEIIHDIESTLGKTIQDLVAKHAPPGAKSILVEKLKKGETP